MLEITNPAAMWAMAIAGLVFLGAGLFFFIGGLRHRFCPRLINTAREIKSETEEGTDTVRCVYTPVFSYCYGGKTCTQRSRSSGRGRGYRVGQAVEVLYDETRKQGLLKSDLHKQTTYGGLFIFVGLVLPVWVCLRCLRGSFCALLIFLHGQYQQAALLSATGHYTQNSCFML